MGLYIKGMELPKEGDWITLRIFPNGQCFLYDWCGNDFDFMEHLTAVPIPTHGRLIDADALKTDCDLVHSMMMFGGEYVYTQTAINNAPTILEAEPPSGCEDCKYWDGERCANSNGKDCHNSILWWPKDGEA